MSGFIGPEFTGMGGITAKVIEDSAHPGLLGKRILTMQLRYPRFVHAELMTHRVFSRNASSSRAIPVSKMLAQVRSDPAMPIHWGANQPGMQARAELDYQERQIAETYWRVAATRAADLAEKMQDLGLHKQVANRILEPFLFISVIVTSTEWANWFELRDHPDADPNIAELARVMKQAFTASTPKRLNLGEWHLPYVTAEERAIYDMGNCRKMSAARCARVSYLTHDGTEPEAGKDFDLFERLVGGVPMHASPIEHQATPDSFDPTGSMVRNPGWAHPELWGNFKTWVQFRKVWEQMPKDQPERTT